MKKSILIQMSIFFVIVIILIFNTNKKMEPFYLEANYYKRNDMIEIEMDTLNKLIDHKKSFALFVYQSMCITSSDFEKVLSEFLEKNQISIYKIAFSDIKDTKIGKIVKYYPTFVIYKEGKMVDFLQADKEEDIKFYTSKEEFEHWFTKYVKLKENEK